MTRKGIILAGGAGTRLHPLTKGVSKQLLPVYDKPMIYYPLSVLMLAGVREILVITTSDDQSAFQRLLGDGAAFGVRLAYAVQPKPEGLAQAYIIAEEHLAGAPSVMILGDNLFYGQGMTDRLRRASARTTGATIFGYEVADPERYGVAEVDADGRVLGIEEKPKEPRSNVAVTGLYFFDRRAPTWAKEVRPSARGELEIVDLHKKYIEEGDLELEVLGRGYAWLDTGTVDSLLQAGNFVRTLEERQSYRIGCVEEIAFRNGWLGVDDLRAAAAVAPSNPYCAYLARLAKMDSARGDA